MNAENIKNKIEEILMEFPVCEYAFGEPSQIPFSDKIFTICQEDCDRYGKSWACPPNAGNIEDNIKKINSYGKFLVFSTVYEVENSWDIPACLVQKREHEELTRAFRVRMCEEFSMLMLSAEEEARPDIYILSSGCSICETCACPDEPCRHPQERLMSMESHGVLIMGMLENIGMTYDFGPGTITYFTMILFGKAKG